MVLDERLKRLFLGFVDGLEKCLPGVVQVPGSIIVTDCQGGCIQLFEGDAGAKSVGCAR